MCGYLFIVVWEMGISGVSCALTITTLTNFGFTTFMPLYISAIKDAIFLPTEETWQNLSEYIGLLIPTFLTEFAVLLPMELLLILSGLISELEQAT